MSGTRSSRLAALFENTTDPVVSLVFEGDEPVVEAVNAAFEDRFGFDAADCVGRSLDDVIVPEGRRASAEALSGRLMDGERFETSVRRRTADGTGTFILRAIPFDDSDGEGTDGSAVTGGYAVYTDVTDRERQEQTLEALHATTRELMTAGGAEQIAEIAVEAASDILDFPLVSLRRHEEGRGLVPVTATDDVADVVGDRSVFEPGESVAWPTYAENRVQVFDDVSGHAGASQSDTPLRSLLLLPLGEFGTLHAGSTVADDFDDSDVYLARILAANTEVALDRTAREAELRRREAELERQNERLERFVDVVSHDLRSPLNVASGRLDLLSAESDEGREHVEAATAALDRMDDLIENLLTLARQGRAVDEVEPVDAASVAESAWGTVATGDADLAVDADLGLVTADADRLRQLFENLFGNAVEHGGDRISVESVDGGDGFAVADDGEGFGDADRDRLFEYGYSTDPDGTGFGLSIVREIADAHGWCVSAEESEAGGARVVVAGVEG
jgi:PAS domain S-box-containing protein